ncbi:MAG: hypothetical protein K8R87_13175 [Verrucomicrobia bacterium]|nr:hypothetical protein [Verrucomicrobiota bacterium]
MNRILTFVLAFASLALVSCECCKSKKKTSCCKDGSTSSCCAEPGKGGAHQH